MSNRKTRSQQYQHLMVETIVTNEMMEAFSNEESIYKRLNPFAYNEDIMDLQDELKKEFWRVVQTQLTDRQKEVIQLYSDGYTQTEIAKMLNVNQSSVVKSLNGNTTYKNGKRCYGGAKRKIKKIIENDKKIQELLNKISELRDLEY